MLHLIEPNVNNSTPLLSRYNIITKTTIYKSYTRDTLKNIIHKPKWDSKNVQPTGRQEKKDRKKNREQKTKTKMAKTSPHGPLITC